MNAVSTAEFVEYLDLDHDEDSAISDETTGYRWPQEGEPETSFQLTPIAAIFEPREWISKHSQKIAELSQMESDWDSYGAEAPNKTAVSYAYEILTTLAYEDLEPSSIDPSAEGGVCISFRKRNKYGDIECFNSGEIYAVTSNNGEETKVWGVDTSLRKMGHDVNKIKSFLHI